MEHRVIDTADLAAHVAALAADLAQARADLKVKDDLISSLRRALKPRPAPPPPLPR